MNKLEYNEYHFYIRFRQIQMFVDLVAFNNVFRILIFWQIFLFFI